MTLKKVRARDIEIAYSEEGEGDRAFVLLHGYSGCRQDFDPVLPELASLGRTLAPDLRGHGQTSRSSQSASYTYDELIADVRAFLDAMKIRRCDLLGHSMGGMVAVRFALVHPERVHSLVMMNTTPRGLDGVDREGFSRAWAVARSAGMVVLQKALESHLAADPDRPPSDRRCETEWGDRYWQHHRRRFHSMDPEAYAQLGPMMLDAPAVTDRLGEIDRPTLVMVGAEDTSFLAAAEVLEQGIPGAVRVTIPEAGHHPHRENKEAWVGAIRSHLTRVRDSDTTPGRGTPARASRGST